jgi:hypothetical protein
MLISYGPEQACAGGSIPSPATDTFQPFTKENCREPIPDPWRQQWQANLIK